MFIRAPTFRVDNQFGSKMVSTWQDHLSSTFVELNCADVAFHNFFGEVRSWSRERMQFSTVRSTGQRVWRSRQNIAKSNDDDFLLSLQLYGNGHALQFNRQATQNVGDFTLYETNSPYQLVFEGEFQQLIARIPRSAFMDRIAKPELLAGRLLPSSTSAVRMASRYLTELAFHSDDMPPPMGSMTSALAFDLIALAFSSTIASQKLLTLESSRSVLLQRILFFVRDNLSAPELSPTGIAAAHGISVRYLNKLFEDQPESLTRMIWRQRLERCANDLQNFARAALTITEIAFSWGFNDSAHFSRSFKAAFGVTPSDYRRRSLAEALTMDRPNGRKTSRSS